MALQPHLEPRVLSLSAPSSTSHPAPSWTGRFLTKMRQAMNGLHGSVYSVLKRTPDVSATVHGPVPLRVRVQVFSDRSKA